GRGERTGTAAVDVERGGDGTRGGGGIGQVRVRGPAALEVLPGGEAPGAEHRLPAADRVVRGGCVGGAQVLRRAPAAAVAAHVVGRRRQRERRRGGPRERHVGRGPLLKVPVCIEVGGGHLVGEVRRGRRRRAQVDAR